MQCHFYFLKKKNGVDARVESIHVNHRTKVDSFTAQLVICISSQNMHIEHFLEINKKQRTNCWHSYPYARDSDHKAIEFVH